MEHPPTNMQRKWPSRKALKAGDIFALQMPDDLFSFGRVIDTTARWTVGAKPQTVLLYIFAGRSEVCEPDDATLQYSNLLIPPALTNRLPWSRGYFKTIGNRGFKPGERLEIHPFRESRGLVFDEFAKEMPADTPTVGPWHLRSFRTIDDAVSQALGFPLIPDDPK